jgi:hypothetical protein
MNNTSIPYYVNSVDRRQIELSHVPVPGTSTVLAPVEMMKYIGITLLPITLDAQLEQLLSIVTTRHMVYALETNPNT